MNHQRLPSLRSTLKLKTLRSQPSQSRARIEAHFLRKIARRRRRRKEQPGRRESGRKTSLKEERRSRNVEM